MFKMESMNPDIAHFVKIAILKYFFTIKIAISKAIAIFEVPKRSAWKL